MVKPSPEVLKKLAMQLLPFIKDFALSLYNREVPELKYRKLLDDIVTFQPQETDFKSCAVVKELKPNGEIKINVVYLDKDNNPIWKDKQDNECCYALVAKKIDQELTNAFGDKDLIIFE